MVIDKGRIYNPQITFQNQKKKFVFCRTKSCIFFTKKKRAGGYLSILNGGDGDNRASSFVNLAGIEKYNKLFICCQGI